MQSLGGAISRSLILASFASEAWVGVISGPSLLLLSYAAESGQAASVQNADWQHWGVLLYAIIGVSLIGHGGAYFLLRRYPVSIVNPGFTLAPILGILSGIYFLDERLSDRVIIGSAMTLLGVLIVTLRESKVAVAAGRPPVPQPVSDKAAGE